MFRSIAHEDTGYSLRDEFEQAVEDIRARASVRHDTVHARLTALEQEDVALERLLADID